MTNYLVFQLYGALAAWGEPAAGEVRHTNFIPSRSAILGLLAAALGIRRNEQARLDALQTHYHIAVRQLTGSVWLQDYHTVQVPPENRKLRYATRRDELRLAKQELRTIVSRRDYRCDAYYLIAIAATEGAPYSLESLCQALLTPVFPLYLGRKSCPPGLPLAPRCVEGELATVLRDGEEDKEEEDHFHDESVVSSYEAQFQKPKPKLKQKPGGLYLPLKPHDGWKILCCWEGEAEPAGLQLQQTVERWDQPLNRRRRQFAPRLQHQGQLEQGGEDVSVQS